MAIATTEETNAGLSVLQPLWGEKAPPKLIEGCPANDPFAGWKAWQDYLASRRKPAALSFLKPKNAPPLLWGWPEKWQRETIRQTLKSPTALAELVIGDDASVIPDLPAALQLVALAHALPQLAQDLPAETWWFLVERLFSTATQARAQQVDWRQDPEGTLRNQLLAGELPLALGYLFPEIRALHALGDDVRAIMSESLIELTDGQGLLHGKLRPVLAPLFASWTRSRRIGAEFQNGAWSKDADLQYQWLVRHAIRLARPDGKFLFAPLGTANQTAANNADDEWQKSLFEMALKLAGDRGDHAAASVALPRGVVAKSLRIKKKDLPRPSLNSDWAGITVMSSGWSQSDSRFAIAYADNSAAIELSVDGETLLAGEWKCETICDGKRVEPTGDWEQLCWESGKEYDFLEIGQPLSAGLRLERQILFGRKDRILYLADIILTGDESPRQLKHSLRLPLVSSAHWKPEAETRDGTISLSKVRAAVMPLGLREWRADPLGGSLVESGGLLSLTQEINGRALCCPVMIDLDSKRSAKERTWRQLTVADWMEIVPADVAVGYRAQSGNKQWMVYRSLGPAANRSLLGHNIAGEFCAGRFRKNGKFKEWIEIEAV